MALVFASSAYCARNANLPNYNSAYTVCFWVRANALSTGATQNPWVGGQNSGNTSVDYVGFRSAAATLSLFTNAASAQQQNGSTTLSANTWYFVALVRSSTTAAILYRGTESVAAAAETSSNTNNISSRTSMTLMSLGSGVLSGAALQAFSGRIHAVKIWDTNLSLAEIQQEQFVWRPQRLTNIRSWYPTWDGSGDRVRDYFNQYNWTENGTITDGDPPSISYG